MATGDQQDMFQRLRGYLPRGWFGAPGDANPFRDALLNGFSTALAYVYSLWAYAKLQTRLAWMSDGWLDMFAADYFGNDLPRAANEGDDSYRARIKASLLREKATRKGISDTLFALTGRYPVIVEPWRAMDCGAYANGANPWGSPIAPCGYGVAGAYGSVNLAAQFFVTAYRPNSVGSFSNVAGYSSANVTVPVGGYGQGALMYGSLSQFTGGVSDSDIYACVAATKAAGVIAWVRISN